MHLFVCVRLCKVYGMPEFLCGLTLYQLFRQISRSVWHVVASVQLVSAAYTHLWLFLFYYYLVPFYCRTSGTRRLLSDFW